MDDIKKIFDDALNNSIVDCNNYKNKNYADCIRCLNCAGPDNLGELICCKEIELAGE
jgi:hypothetical protein